MKLKLGKNDDNCCKCEINCVTEKKSIETNEKKMKKKNFKTINRVPLKETDCNTYTLKKQKTLENPIINSNFEKKKLNIITINNNENEKDDEIKMLDLTSLSNNPSLVCKKKVDDNINLDLINKKTDNKFQILEVKQINSNELLTGEELLKWQRAWKQIMKKLVIYFENVSESNIFFFSEYKRASKYLKKFGCKFSLFFNSDVTIIVTRRAYDLKTTYSSNDVFSHVQKLKIKVWNYEKVFRFLKNLTSKIVYSFEFEKNVLKKKDQLISNTEFNLNPEPLNQKKKEGVNFLFCKGNTSNSLFHNSNIEFNDLHYLKHNYIYIYDKSQKVRPIAVKEWKNDTYPKLCLTLDGRCPFIDKPNDPTTLERKKLRRKQRFEMTYQNRLMLKKVYQNFLINLKKNKILNISNDLDKVKNTCNKNFDKNKDDFEEINLNPKNNSKKKAHSDDLLFFNNNLFKSNFYENFVTTTNKSSNTLNLSMDIIFNNKRSFRNGMVNKLTQSSYKDFKILKKKIILKKRKQELSEYLENKKKVKKDPISGYCENCHIKYKCLDHHINSNVHREFASNNKNFLEIDKFIFELKKKKIVSNC